MNTPSGVPFDLEAFLTDLNLRFPLSNSTHTRVGAAGVRLQPHHTTSISDDLLRDFAQVTLGADRCSQGYLQALRVVLGNQAVAERQGFVLEMNIRTPFTTDNVMRGIVNQMKTAGVTQGHPVGLGSGKMQVVQCYGPPAGARHALRMTDKQEPEAPEELCWLCRMAEEADDVRREESGKGSSHCRWADLGAPCWLTLSPGSLTTQ